MSKCLITKRAITNQRSKIS